MNTVRAVSTDVSCGVTFWKGGLMLRCHECAALSTLDRDAWETVLETSADVHCGECGGRFAGVPRIRVVRG